MKIKLNKQDNVSNIRQITQGDYDADSFVTECVMNITCPICGLVYNNVKIHVLNFCDSDWDYTLEIPKCDLGHDLLDDTQETVCDKLQNTTILVRAL